MSKTHLLAKVKSRKEQMGLTLENLAELSKLSHKTINEFFRGHDVEQSTLEKITNIFGLDTLGNEIVDIQTLIEERAYKRALYIVSLVQDTSSLEMQGLDKDDIQEMIHKTKNEFLYGKYRKNLWNS